MILFKHFRSVLKYIVLICVVILGHFYLSENTEQLIQAFFHVKENTIEKPVQNLKSQLTDYKNQQDANQQNMVLHPEPLASQFYEENVPVYSGAIQVTSGVTFKMITLVDEGWRKKIVRNIRLYGVETCETRQFASRNGIKWPCGAFVTAWLVSKTIDKNVTCRQARVIQQVHYAQCFVDGVDLARLGLIEGLMVLTKDQHNFPSPADYKNLQLTAQKAQNGLWSSQFQQPEDWRRDHGSYNPIDHNG
ncbi:nuclease [Bartonella tribocorum]|uniref:Nuclease n=1 Tax=Bartonella tribocorum TaxID=85701 RepID=A0A2M6USR5_9HYPH|nr:nuclease [Bartonella tribocorum]PIT69229.1 nuclease [Bartonella tribocorum]